MRDGTKPQQAQEDLAGQKAPEDALDPAAGDEPYDKQNPHQNGRQLVEKGDGGPAEAVENTVQISGEIEDRTDPGQSDKEFAGKSLME